MSRPRKNSGLPEARQRLVDAFWELLQEDYFHKITVGAIAQRADCNRGTFYYHFSDMEELASCAVEHELLGEDSITSALFQLISATDTENIICNPLLFQRIWLLMDKGGTGMVDEKVKEVVADIWRAILCDDESDLQPVTYLILEYAVSGLLGMLKYLGSANQPRNDSFFQTFNSKFLQHNAHFLIERISEAQGVSYEEIVSRFSTVSRLYNMHPLPIAQKPRRRYA